jgi:carboxypeptidase family protein
MQRATRPSLSGLVMLLACLSLPAWSQQFQGSFTGTVIDQSGAVVPGVKVIATERDTGFSRSVVTLDDGSFTIPLLPPGNYQVVAEKEGFDKASQGPIPLSVDQHPKIDFQMKVGSQTTTVNVEAAPPVLDTQSSAVGTTIEREKVGQLPLNGRHFLELTLFTPGVVPGTDGSENSTRGGAINVNGMRETSNNFLLDGMDNTSVGVGQFVVTPPIDSVQEFRMETGTYEAKFGSQSGAQINVVTKSGTNHFHGTFHEFLRNSALDTRNFFDASVPPFKRNQFGATVGGPVKLPGYDGTDRTFFFGAFEGLRHRRDFFRHGTVPTLAERGGNFSDLFVPGCPTKTVLINPLALLSGSVSTFTNVATVLPTGAPDVTGQALLSLEPKPNTPTGPCGGSNFTSEIHEKVNFDNYVGRLDHRWGTKDTLFFRYNLTSDHETNPSDPIPGFGKVTQNGFIDTGVSWTHSFTPALINEFRLSYNRWQLRWNNQDQGQDIGKQLGIVGTPTLFRQTGVPNLNFSGYNGLGAGTNVPQAGAVNTFELTEDLTHVHGKHTFTYGADIRTIKRGSFFIDETIRNQFDFTGIATNGAGMLPQAVLAQITAQVKALDPSTTTVNFGNGAADALLGLAQDWVHGFSTYISGAGSEYDPFVQDTWKVRRDLTLNLGLRYEYNSLVTDKYDHFSSFDFSKGLILEAGRQQATLLSFNPTTGLYVPSGTENLGSVNENRALYHPDRNNFAPRLGFAWQPFNNDKTVIRGGSGAYYDQTFGDVYLSKVANPPFAQINFATLLNAIPLIVTNPAVLGTGYLIQNAFQPNVVAPLFPVISPFEANFQDATIYEWSLDVQRELPGSWLLDLGYVGTRGLHLARHTNPNEKVPNPVTQTAIRPYPGLDSDFSYTTSSAKSIYHSLQMKVERHYTHGLAVIGAYTYSKSLDTGSTFYGTDRATDTEQNYHNLAAEKGRSDFDFRHRFSLAYIYDLPFGNTVAKMQNDRLNYLIQGWQLAGITTLQSGAPYNVGISGDVSHTGQGADRPNVTGSPFYPANQTVNQWALASAFSRPLDYTFGNAGRDILTGPRLSDWDFSLIRMFRLTETRSLEFRTEVFNILNQANFHVPNSNVADPNFGRIFNTVQPIAGLASGGPGDPREIQFGLKLIW